MKQPSPTISLSSQMPQPVSPPRTPARFNQPKYHKVLSSPLYTKHIDLARASEWLTDYLTKDCPTEFMPAIRFDLMGHIEDHEMPDGVLAQSRLLDMNLIPVDEVEKMMQKFWDRLLKEQARNRDADRLKKLERIKDQDKIGEKSGKSKRPSPPKEPAHEDWSWGWSNASSSSSRALRSPTSSAPSELKRARADSDRPRAPIVHGREAHLDDLSRRASLASNSSRSAHSARKFTSQYSPGPRQSSSSRHSDHKPGYSPSFFAGVSQSS